MIESLATFQSRLGSALLGEDTCPIDPHSPGFRFTMMVRRSWCEGRSIMAVRAVLMLMPEIDRQRLVREYVDQGGGLAWFQATERESFLAFLASRLPDPSHALTICRMSQALAQAQRASSTFVAPEERAGIRPVERSRHAALVWFYADPGTVMNALDSGELPPLGPPAHAFLFAPGIINLFRLATGAEAALWATLAVADAPHRLVTTLLSEGVLVYQAGDADALHNDELIA
jgi:hypothetical protein